jgi:predicted permease
MTSPLQDFRYALRQLRKSPGFTLTSILTLGLGIGATMAVFSVMNAVLLNPSGIPHPKDVVAVRAKYAFGDLANIGLSSTDFGDAVSAKNIFTSAAVLMGQDFNYTSGDSMPQRLSGAMVSWQWFDVFWAHPYLGRVFRPEEDQPKANHEVILSYSAWRQRFGGDASIIGRKLQLDEEPYEVVGVMGPDFAWPNQAELWIPIGLPPGSYFDPQLRHNEYLFGAARLAPGVTLAQANAYLATRSAQDAASEQLPINVGWGMFCMPLIEYVTGDLREPLFILLTAVGTILLIVCANIAGLQLARASGRQREFSIQIALGASNYRVQRQALTEGLCLAFAGGAIGLLLAKGIVPLLLLLAPADLMLNISVRMGGTVILFLIALTSFCALLCGVAPAWRLTRGNWFQALQEGGRSEGSSRGRQRFRSGLVITEIAMAMVLLLASGLLVRSLGKLEEVKTGFDPDGLMSAELSLPETTYKNDEQQASFYRALEERLRAIPGVSHAAISNGLPFTNAGGSGSFKIEGQTLPPNDPGPHGNRRSVSPDYFATLRIPLLRGRVLSQQDRAETEPVCVIDDFLARRYWPGTDPIGQHIQLYAAAPGQNPPWITVVGIVGHAKTSSLQSDTTEGFYYMPLAQSPQDSAGIVVRTSGNPESMSDALRAAVSGVDPAEALYDFKTMQERVDESLTGQRFLVILLTVFAGLALVLAALGVYGIISYTVRLRDRELGVRLALGADRRNLFRLIIGQGFQYAIVGFALGLFVTLLLGKILSSLLFGTSLFNPVTLFIASAVLAATILFACYIPARRAAKVDPMVALRYE